MADRQRKLSQAGMRRFLVDTRNQGTGIHQSERNSNLEEPRDGVPNPDQQQPSIGNVTRNLLELVDFLKDNNEEVRYAYDHGGLNCKMTSHKIQKDFARCCAEEVTEAIMGEIGDRNFSVLIDESRDISVKEQMGVVLRHKLSVSRIRGQGYDGASNMRGEFGGLQKLVRHQQEEA
ncbi:uncharacterized protein LOC110429989 isoform X2 [Sorghum bicolor]|uniref:uncharacterized protein LOC110429989 isoform X2 n=1 Tax=Sorghum bicolor TaxID=4558 RepID=UPI000B424722|nr:uncharacterized protein LOC110429989 isoform X2 [Sorghum bicolor]|eukprot:XP_021302443.1 uncharacterized protein LOC110429989 isoform X2 [Sorghum bicolor]